MSLDPRPGRRLMLVVSISCTLLIVAGTALAYLSFRQAGSRVIGSSELGCRVAAAEAYGDRLSLIRLLQALASDPSIISADDTTIDDRLRAVGGESFGFTGGLAWVDVSGIIRVSTKGSSDLAADGSWWRDVVSAREWTTSRASTSIAFSGEVMVFAVPTFDTSGVVNGVLAGGLGATWLRRQATEHLRTLEDERYGRRDDLLVIDKGGQLIVAPGLLTTRDISTSATYRRIIAGQRRSSHGTLVDVTGLAGEPGRIVSYAGTGSFGDIIVVEGSTGAAFAARNQTLAGRFIAVVVLSLITLLGTAFLGRRLDRLARERDDLYQAEHAVVVALQHSLMASQLPQGAEARYLPARSILNVGGDWYDAIALPSGRVLLVVGDVVGHGVRAALAMGHVRTATRALAARLGGPADVLTALDRHVATMDDVIFCTAVCIEVDLHAGKLRYAAAGHPPSLLRHADGTVSTMESAGEMPLGLASERRREFRMPVPAGSVLVLYTDGLVERRDESIDAGIARLAEAVSRHLPGDDGWCDSVIAHALAGTKQSDDIVLLSYLTDAPAPPATPATPATPAAPATPAPPDA